MFEGRKAINASMYEVAGFEALNNGLRSGDLYAVGSRRYQTFESYLLSKEHWTQLKETDQTRLALGGTAAGYLEGRRQHLANLLAKLARDVDSLESVTVDNKGRTASDRRRGPTAVEFAALGTRGPERHGIVYASRFGASFECWAIFDSASIESVGSVVPISLDDTDLQAVARVFALQLPSVLR